MPASARGLSDSSPKTFTRGDNEEVYLEPVDDRPDPEREIMSRQLRVAIDRAERKLSAQQKIIFRLRHYEDRPLEEIADLLGLRAGTVRAHLFRAVHKVRKKRFVTSLQARSFIL